MIGTRLGPYEITGKLGEGGMGEVYRATDTKLKREVAIKVLGGRFLRSNALGLLRLPYLGLMCAPVLVVFVCGPRPAVAEPVEAPAPAVMETGQRFVTAINNADGRALNALFDVDALGQRVLRSLDLNAVDRARYLAALRAQHATLGYSVAAQMAAQRAKAKLLPSAPAGTGPEFMVRITTTDARDNEAHGYLQVELGPDGRIVDMYDHGLALSASGQLAFSAAGMLTTREAVRVLLGEAGDAVEVAVLMQRLTAAVSVGDTRRAHGVLLEMPESIRARREFATLRVAMSRGVGMEAYREALAELARRHGTDKKLQFILIDHYLLTGQHELALRAVDAAAGVVGDDEVMDLNRCTASLALGRKADALAACDRAIARDRAWESPRWTRVRIGLETKDAQLAIESLAGIEETRGGKHFDVARLAANQTYAWLVTQPEFTAWAAERGGPPLH